MLREMQKGGQFVDKNAYEITHDFSQFVAVNGERVTIFVTN
jgi:hypothetical protein